MGLKRSRQKSGVSSTSVVCAGYTDWSCWDANNDAVIGHVTGNHGICSNLNVTPKRHGAHNLRARADVTMTAEFHRSRKRNLLEDQTVRTDAGSGVYDDPGRVGQHQPALNVAAKVYF